MAERISAVTDVAERGRQVGRIKSLPASSRCVIIVFISDLTIVREVNEVCDEMEYFPALIYWLMMMLVYDLTSCIVYAVSHSVLHEMKIPRHQL